MKVRSSGRPPIVAVYVASSTTTSPRADHVGVGVVGVARGAEPADREPDPGLELGGAAGVEDDVVHAPVVGDDGEAALGDDEQDRDVGAGGADQPAQVAGCGEVLAAVDEDEVGLGGVEQRAALGGQDLHGVASSASPGSTSAEGCRALVSSSRVLIAGPSSSISRASPRPDEEGYPA